MDRNEILSLLEDPYSGFSSGDVANYFNMHPKKLSREMLKNNIDYKSIFMEKKLRSYEKRILDSRLTSLEDIYDIFSNDKLKLSRYDIKGIVSKLIDNGKIDFFKCHHCSGKHNGSYGSGVFCSKECARSYACKHSDKQKKVESLKLTLGINKWTPLSKDKFERISKKGSDTFSLKKKVGHAHTPESKKKLSESLKKYYKEHPEAREKLSYINKNRPPISEDTREKLRAATNKRIAEGLHTGWTSRSKESYAEKIWSKVLKDNGIVFEREFVLNKSKDLYLDEPSNYFLDFFIISKSGIMIDLEIDGKQHRSPEREASDISRDWAIRNSGVKVVRLPWINPHHNKKNFIRQVDFLLDIVRN